MEMNDYQSLMEKARRHNESLAKVDGGLAAFSPRMQIRTAMSAIECGIRMGDWSIVAEGQALLEALEKTLPFPENAPGSIEAGRLNRGLPPNN